MVNSCYFLRNDHSKDKTRAKPKAASGSSVPSIHKFRGERSTEILRRELETDLMNNGINLTEANGRTRTGPEAYLIVTQEILHMIISVDLLGRLACKKFDELKRIDCTSAGLKYLGFRIFMFHFSSGANQPLILFFFFNQDISRVGRPEEDGNMSTTTTMEAINGKILSLYYGESMLNNICSHCVMLCDQAAKG
ncbi:G3BP-like protein [Artemisia annua]|uniref:G3BP-like protein n=1 Tax=Artemisia annua TaxID=35608 RepID=A0A2U1PV18_ARTAN|nr:G3BP-like protein [Artemisia annua]